MANYKKEDNGTITARYWLDGKLHTKRGFKSQKEAEYRINKLVNREEQDCYIKFYTLADEYREYHKKKVTYGTYKRTELFWKEYILPNFRNKSVCEISALECLKFWEYLDGLDKSTVYKNDILGTLKGAMQHAMKFYGLKTDPTASLDRFKRTKDEKQKSYEKNFRVWDIKEFKKFINEVDSVMYQLIFKVLFFTGMRKGEMLALTWNDLLDHKIAINKSLTRKAENSPYEIKEPKNLNSTRIIQINDTLYKDLLNYKKQEMKIPGFNTSWFIFGRNKPIAENTLTRAKDVAIKKAGVKRIIIHEFRHSHGSILISNGMNLLAVSRRLGHSSLETTLRIYSHLIGNKNDEEIIKDIERMNKDIIAMA